jgi:hypothetical protein
MPQHRITVTPSRPLHVENTDLIIEIYADESKYGELRVSRGSIDWAPRHHHFGKRLEWEEFNDLMVEHGHDH